MTKIVITSDLHLGITTTAELSTLVSSIAAEEPDLTVLAGDIAEGLPNFVTCLKLFAQLPGDVAILAGNHDVWARANYASQELWERHLPRAVQATGMLWLEETVWQREGVAVAGSLAWYDYSAVDATIPSYPPAVFVERKGWYNADAKYVRWPWSDQEFAAKLGDALCERLRGLEADPGVRNVLVVSHVPLVEEQMYRKPYDPRWGFSNAYFGNLTLGQRVLAMSKLRAIVSGHTHVRREGLVKRPGFPKEPAVVVSVLASDYHAPLYRVIDTTRLASNGSR
ncbi:MAG: metallophosphoesterase [Chloroflexi bacterium]|nr:MAG: metallophosphoesterase [Chloroflexota bacterium]